MQPGLLVKLRPLGPWRYGPASGGHDSVDTLYRSDRLFSALTLAMQRLGMLDAWLAATVHSAKPAVVFSSLFPFQAETLFAAPPASLWPPPINLLTTPSPVFLTKIRWKTAAFVPLSVIDSRITGQAILADQWLPDPESACLLRRDRPNWSPFRVITRQTAPVDRLRRTSSNVDSLTCVEFEQNAGLWTVARFEDADAERAWSAPVQSAFRLLADSGFGGGRSKGWGQTQTPEFQPGTWPANLFPKLGRLLRNSPQEAASSPHALYWLLSLYTPAPADQIDWSGGSYSVTQRDGRVESPSATSGAIKKSLRMINEGCVLLANDAPVGAAPDVAPDGFAHPVYRSGLALALRLPVVEDRKPVETAPPELDPEPEPKAEPPTPLEEPPTTAEAPAEEPVTTDTAIEEPPHEV